MNADVDEAEKFGSEHEPIIKVVLYDFSLQASYDRKEYSAYKKALEKPVTWRDKLLKLYTAPKPPSRKSITARWVLFDENIILGNSELLEEALKSTDNMAVIVGADKMLWIGMNTHNTTEGPRRLIRSSITVPQLVFNELYADLGNFPSASVILHLKVALNNKSTKDPLLPNNWFKVDGQKDEADFVMMRVDHVEVAPPFEHAQLVEHFMQSTSKVFPDRAND